MILAAVSGCVRTQTITLPPIIEYERVYINRPVPDTTLGALDDLRDSIVAHGRVVEIVHDDSGRVRAQFAGAPDSGPARVSFAMLQLVWMQSRLDAIVEIVDRRSEH